MDQIPDGIAVFLGSLSGRQNNELRYFAGVEVPRANLIIDGSKGESTLFYTTDERYLRGENLSPALATDPLGATGVERHFPAEEFSTVFGQLMRGARVLYTPFDSEVAEPEVSTPSEWDGRPTRRRQFVAVVQARFPGVEVRNCSEAIWEQRRFKSPAEIDATLQAGRIGASAMVEVMKAGRPGMFEYELSSLFEYTCKRQGAKELAFPTIISSAENHPYLHYTQYNRLLVDGDFLVVDAGPKWQDYCMDTTISFPINGRFSPRQREIYQACLEISKGCLARYRPGLTGYQIGEEVRRELEEKGYDLSTNAFTRMRFFREGGITHYVGLETHDAGGPDLPPDRPLEAGMVFACDVFGTWPDEDLGVRVENTVVVTETGCEVLNPGIPREIEEIEALMAG
jgi:Xaa-Pro aminopeptidase